MLEEVRLCLTFFMMHLVMVTPFYGDFPEVAIFILRINIADFTVIYFLCYVVDFIFCYLCLRLSL